MHNPCYRNYPKLCQDGRNSFSDLDEVSRRISCRLTSQSWNGSGPIGPCEKHGESGNRNAYFFSILDIASCAGFRFGERAREAAPPGHVPPMWHHLRTRPCLLPIGPSILAPSAPGSQTRSLAVPAAGLQLSGGAFNPRTFAATIVFGDSLTVETGWAWQGPTQVICCGLGCSTSLVTHGSLNSSGVPRIS